MNQHLLVKMRQFGLANLGNSLAIPAIGALNWTVRRSGIFPAQLNDSELIRGSLILSAPSVAVGLRIQPIDAINWLKRSAGIS
jgi:hypothetical protein